MSTESIVQEIRVLDTEILGIESLTQNLVKQLDFKKATRNRLRIELKIAFQKKHQIKQFLGLAAQLVLLSRFVAKGQIKLWRWDIIWTSSQQRPKSRLLISPLSATGC